MGLELLSSITPDKLIQSMLFFSILVRGFDESKELIKELMANVIPSTIISIAEIHMAVSAPSMEIK